jgi:molybdate/tungstate transport system substrate-binding protein
MVSASTAHFFPAITYCNCHIPAWPERSFDWHSVGVLMYYRITLMLGLTIPTSGSLGAQENLRGDLLVFNAGSLAKPFSELLREFRSRHPEVVPAHENSGSLEAARKLTELGKIPDVLALADYGVIPKLLIPRYVSWFSLFARTSMVLAYTGQSTAAGEINGTNWWQVLQRPNVRWGHSDPALDPAGYRSLMVFQLAERFYRQPGLAAGLEAARPNRYIRAKSADLIALLQVGELDYAWEYEAVAKLQKLPYVSLPPEINLGDTRLAEVYANASVRLPGASRRGADSVEFRGEPIAYALTIPKAAPHPETAQAFVRFLFSPEGQAILKANGFTVLEKPVLGGPEPPPAGLF